MSSESTSQQVTEISAESGEQILSLLQVQGEEGSGHETIQLVTTTGDGECIDGQETLLLQPAIEVNGERHVILQQAQDPNTGEVLVFLQGENGETVCLPPEALNANIVQMGDGSGQVYTLALPSDGDGSSVVVVSESDGTIEGGATLVTDETLGNVIAATSSAGTIDLAGTIETIVTSGGTFSIEQLSGEASSFAASSSSSATQVVQAVAGPLMATTIASSSTTQSNDEASPGTTSKTGTETEIEKENSNVKTDDQGNIDVSSATTTTTTTTTSTESEVASTTVTEETEATSTTTTSATTKTTSSSSITEGSAAGTIAEEMNSGSNSDDINSKLNEAVSKLGEEKEIICDKSETLDGNNMNYGSAVIQVQDANSTNSLDSLVANAMLAAGESNYVIMTTGEDGELPKEISLADVINAGSASGQTIFLQTSEGLVACQAATTGEDGSLQIVADGSGNAIAVSTSSNVTSSSFSETTLAYTLSSTSSGIELTPVTNVVSATNSSTTRNNQVSTVPSRSRLSRQARPRTNIPASSFTTPTSTLSSSTSSTTFSSSTLSSSLAAAAATATATATTTIGETLLLPSKHLVSSSSSLSIQSSGVHSSLNNTSNSSGITMMNSNSINMNTNSRRRTLTNRGRSNISVSITPSSTATSSLSTTSSSPIIPVQPDAIHSSSSDFSTLTKSSASSETTDSSILTEGVSRPSQLAASRRTYSKKNNIVWLNPETTTISKRTNNTSTTTTSNSNSNSNLIDGKSCDESDEVIATGGGEDASKTIDNMNDSKMIDLPIDSTNDTTLTTTTGISISPSSSVTNTTTSSSSASATTSFPTSKLTVKPPTTLTVSNVPTLRSNKKVSEPIVKSSSVSSSVTPLSPSKSTTPVSAMVSKDYSRVIANVDKSSSSSGVPSMIKVAAVPQLGRVVTPPVRITSPVKPSSPVKITSPTSKITSPKITSPSKFGSPTKTQQPAIESTSDIDLDFGVADYEENEGGGGGEKGISDVILSPSQSPASKKVSSPTKSPTPSSVTSNSEKSKLSTKEGVGVGVGGGSESESDSVSKKQVNFVTDDSQESSGVTLSATPSSPMKSPSRNNQQLVNKQDDLSDSVNNASGGESPSTRSRKRFSESESGNDQVMVDESNVKTVHSETGTPLKKRVNFALADSGDSDMILSSPTKVTDSASSIQQSAEIPITRSRKRKSDIETIADLSDSMVLENSVLTFTTSTESVTTTPCPPPPKKRVNLALAQSNADNDLFATPLSPVKSPKRDDTQSSSISTKAFVTNTPALTTLSSSSSSSSSSTPPATPTQPLSTTTTTTTTSTSTTATTPSGSILDTPVSEARSTRSTRKRRSETEFETSSSADESSMREDIFSAEFVTPAKKRVNFAPGTSIEVIRDDEDEDGDDDDSESTPFMDEKKKEKRLSGRKRTPVNRPLLLDSPSKAQASPQPILKISKRVVDSGPLLMHFGSDPNEGESEGGVGGDDSDGTVIKGLLESRGPSEFFDFTINDCCFHIRHQSGRLNPFSPNESDGNYACLNNCGYRTSRMNNIILHNKDQCTVIKMQWQSEIQHLINRQRQMNQDDSTPSTPPAPPAAATNNTDTDTDTGTAPITYSSPTKSTTSIQEEEEATTSPTYSSQSPTHETSEKEEEIPETPEATETTKTPIVSEVE